MTDKTKTIRWTPSPTETNLLAGMLLGDPGTQLVRDCATILDAVVRDEARAMRPLPDDWWHAIRTATQSLAFSRETGAPASLDAGSVLANMEDSYPEEIGLDAARQAELVEWLKGLRRAQEEVLMWMILRERRRQA